MKRCDAIFRACRTRQMISASAMTSRERQRDLFSRFRKNITACHRVQIVLQRQSVIGN
jgi:hypothetical protein